MSAYKTYYEMLEKSGLDYYSIKKMMINVARSNEIDGVVKYDENYNDIKNCGGCNTPLGDDDYFAEITDYACTVWYKCPKCKKYNHYVF